MITLLIIIAGAAFAFRFSTRISSLESTVAELNGRLGILERSREAGGTTPAIERRTTVPPPAERPAPAPPPQHRVTPEITIAGPQPMPAAALPQAASIPPASPHPPQSAAPPAATRPAAERQRTPVPSQAAPTTAAAPASIAAARSGDGLETRIGSRGLLYVGVVAIIVGVSYFEKLAIDNHWVSETTRVVQGGIIGLLLIAGGLRIVRAGYRTYGQVVSGCGVAVLYVSIYAAFNTYHLVAQPVAFMLMTAVTMLAAWLADRQRSQSLALVAVGGGFATPFLLPTGNDAEIALFGYETILIGGTMVLSRRREWPTLNIVSYLFTFLTVAGWAGEFYTPSKYLVTELFLTVFCGMFVYIVRQNWSSQRERAGLERAILSTAPLAYYFASLGVLGEHSPALLIYLILVSLTGVIAGRRMGAWIRLGFWFAAAAPLLIWSATHGGHAWLVAGLGTWTAAYVLNIAGLLEATIGDARGFGAADILLLHLNGLAAYAGAYLLIEPVRMAANAPLATGLALVHGGLGYLTLNRRREEALHFTALAFTLLTIAIALQFDGASVTGAWAAEGAALVWLGLHERRTWLRAAGLTLFAVSIGRLLDLQFADPRVGQLILWNRRAACGAFVIALTWLMTVAYDRLSTSPRRHMQTGIGLVTANLLLFSAAASEIVAHWRIHTPPPFEPIAQLIDALLIIGAATIWLALVRQQEWMRAVGAVLAALAAYMLLSIQLLPTPREYVTLLNGRAAAGLFAIAVLYGLAALHRRRGAHLKDLAVNLAVLMTAASLLSLSFLTSEIDAYWAARGASDVWSIGREGLKAIAWAGVGSFLVWQGLARRRTWIRAIGGALLAIAILRLLVVQYADASPGYTVAFNARVIASVFVVAVMYGLASLYRTAGDVAEARWRPSTILWLLANVLTLTLLTSEITAYWHLHDAGPVSTLAGVDSHFAREMMLSVTWALYATVLIVVGLRKNYAPIRYFAISVFAVTIVKVFAIDLAELDRIYRVVSVIGLGIALLLTSYLYQRFSGTRGLQN